MSPELIGRGGEDYRGFVEYAKDASGLEEVLRNELHPAFLEAAPVPIEVF